MHMSTYILHINININVNSLKMKGLHPENIVDPEDVTTITPQHLQSDDPSVSI